MLHLQSALYRCYFFFFSLPKANNIINIISVLIRMRTSTPKLSTTHKIFSFFFCSSFSGSTFFWFFFFFFHQQTSFSFLSYTHNSFLCTHIHHIYNLFLIIIFFFGKVRRKREERKKRRRKKNWFKFIVSRRRISCRGGAASFFQLKRWKCLGISIEKIHENKIYFIYIHRNEIYFFLLYFCFSW